MEDCNPSTSSCTCNCAAPSTSKVIDEDVDNISESEAEPIKKIPKPLNVSEGAVQLRKWLNKSLRIEMTDKRILIGIFLCTDRDANVILNSCSEYLPEEDGCPTEEPRMLGLVMVPGKHIVSVSVDQTEMDYYNSAEVSEDIVV